MKKQKKLLSILLAVVLVITSISTSMIAFAENNYKPQYTDKVTEEDVTAMIGDINTILDENVLTGATIEEVYKMLPSLKSLLMLEGSSDKASDKGLFYKTLQPERFADLPEGQLEADVYDEDGNLEKAGTLTAFFNEHPIVCENASDFKAELDIIVKMVLVPNIMDTLQILPMFAGDFTAPSVFGTGIDEVCKALGIEQEKSAASVLGFNAFVTGESYDIDGANAYIQNITAALFPDTANSVIDMIQNALVPENAKLLYSGLSKIINNLDVIVKGLASNLSGMGVDVTAVQATVSEIKDTFAKLPTTGEGEDKMLDIQGVVGFLVADLTDGAVGIRFGSKPGTGGINLAFKEMQIDRVANAESNADVVKIVYDYLYDNILGNATTKSLLQGVISGLEDESVTPEMKEAILGYMELSNEDLAYEGIAAVAELAGRELPDPVEPTDPAEPTDPTDPTNPTKPSEPTTTPADNTTKADTNNTNKTVNNAKIPNTGAEAETAFTAILSAAAGVALLSIVAAYTLKRKARNI